MSDCGVCLYSEYDCSVDFCNVLIRAARKEHKCYECGKPIPKGATYQYASGSIVTGKHCRLHICCLGAVAAFVSSPENNALAMLGEL